jgi:hypothetical protein
MRHHFLSYIILFTIVFVYICSLSTCNNYIHFASSFSPFWDFLGFEVISSPMPDLLIH